MKICMGCMRKYNSELTVCPHCGYVEGTKPEKAQHMEAGNILAERYIIGKVLGYGGFGVTYLGWDALLETKLAIKEYMPSEFSTRAAGQTEVSVFSGGKGELFNKGKAKFLDEARRLAKFSSCKGIVNVTDCIECNNTAYIIMEYLDGETLESKLKREGKLSEKEALEIMLPVINSLEVVHKDGILHRDIAPDNIFITKDGQVKLIDFGAARFAVTPTDESRTVMIKSGYSPEEQYQSRSEQGTYTDVYAVGATLYKALTGVVPPNALERRAAYENTKKDILPAVSHYVKDISDSCNIAVMNALNIRAEDRTQTMAELSAELMSETPAKRKGTTIKRTDKLKWPLWLKITVAILAAALVIFGILFGTGVIGFNANEKDDIDIPEGYTRVPSVVNNTVKDGDKKLRKAELHMRIEDKQPSEETDPDKLLRQFVDAGSVVKKESVVGVVVSAGISEQIIQPVEGMEKEAAVKIIKGLGMEVKTVEEFSNTVAPGYIVSQSKKSGEKVNEGSRVYLAVSKGTYPEVQNENIGNVQIDNYVGKTYDALVEDAAEQDFVVEVSQRIPSSEYKENEIIDQYVSDWTTDDGQQVVEVVISDGDAPVTVPDVTYRKENRARQLLESYGFEVSVSYEESENVAAGTVIEQTPKANKKAERNSVVELVVSTGTPYDQNIPDEELSGNLLGKVCMASDRTTPISQANITIRGNDDLTMSAMSNSSGNYALDLPAGDYTVDVQAAGYIDFSGYINVPEGETAYMETFLMVEGTPGDEGIANGYIYDALTGSTLEGVELSIRSGWNNTEEGDVAANTETDSSGYYTLDLPIGNYTVSASKNGYVPTSFNIVVQSEEYQTEQNGTMTPVTENGAYRIVLTWGEEPSDLDSHVCGTLSSGDHFHVSYEYMLQNDGDDTLCVLDVDDTDSFGPETVTLCPTTKDAYYYFVHRFSEYGDLSSSGAQVKVYKDSELLKTFNVPTNLGDGRFWNVFSIVDGEIVVNNTITEEPDVPLDYGIGSDKFDDDNYYEDNSSDYDDNSSDYDDNSSDYDDDSSDYEDDSSNYEDDSSHLDFYEIYPKGELDLTVDDVGFNAIAAGENHSVGLRSDGTVYAAGADADFVYEVSNWTDIVSVAAGSHHTVGLRSDGTVVAVGANSSGQCDVGDWVDMVAIAAGPDYTLGLRSDGAVIATRANSKPSPCELHVYANNFIAIAAGVSHSVGLLSDGTLKIAGDIYYSGNQYDAYHWTDIVAIAAGGNHTLGLRVDGMVLAVGDNEDGQCDVQEWRDIAAIAAGAAHTVGLRSDGTVVAVGDNTHGQCNVEDWTDIVAIAAGDNWTLGLRSDGTVVSTKLIPDESDYGVKDVGQTNVDGWTDIKTN